LLPLEKIMYNGINTFNKYQIIPIAGNNRLNMKKLGAVIMYEEDDYLSLSGIQHFAFCRRQWALIHIEQQWQENLRTIEGQFLHEHVHEVSIEKRGPVIVVRSMAVHSRELGLRGVCDVVEFHRDDQNGIRITGHSELYRPIPVEYKRGKPKEGDADILQLCAQAMCLEEMLVCQAPVGHMFYGEPRRRLTVELSEAHRSRVRETVAEMHEYNRRGYTPKVKSNKSCKSCSLADVCLPKLGKNISAKAFVNKRMGEEAES
jgi:CRISPR-associated exonuclease Cas4